MILELLGKVSSELEKRNIAYMVSGSIALIAYTSSRSTRDIDIVVELNEKDIEPLLEIFKDGFYVSRETVKEEVRRKGMFNVIDQSTGFKIDFIVKNYSEYRAMEFSRRRRSEVLGFKTWIVAPEDLIISKLIWIQELYSERQMEDIINLLENPEIDRQYIVNWSNQLNLNTFNLFGK